MEALTLLGSIIGLGVLVFVVTDARKRNANTVGWGLLAFLTGPIGLFIWLCARPSMSPPGSQHGNPADTYPRELIAANWTEFRTGFLVVGVILAGIGIVCPTAFGHQFNSANERMTFALAFCGIGAFIAIAAISSVGKKLSYFCPFCNQILHEGTHQAARSLIGETCPRCHKDLWNG